jgi:hypothetical protein
VRNTPDVHGSIAASCIKSSCLLKQTVRVVFSYENAQQPCLNKNVFLSNSNRANRPLAILGRLTAFASVSAPLRPPSSGTKTSRRFSHPLEYSRFHGRTHASPPNTLSAPRSQVMPLRTKGLTNPLAPPRAGLLIHPFNHCHSGGRTRPRADPSAPRPRYCR